MVGYERSGGSLNAFSPQPNADARKTCATDPSNASSLHSLDPYYEGEGVKPRCIEAVSSVIISPQFEAPKTASRFSMIIFLPSAQY